MSETTEQQATATRAKFIVQSVTHFPFGQEVKGTAVSDDSTPENKRFTQFTPSGDFRISISNPALSGFFEPGKYYYFDITPADDEK